jgi:hypothetical protein
LFAAMRTLAIALTAALLLFGCGGKKGPAPKDAMVTDANNPDGPSADAPGADAATAGELGTSGYPGLDWGASLDDVKAKFPKAAPGTDNLSITGNHAGKSGVTTFELKDGKLFRISVSFEEEYPSMGECQPAWAEVRKTLDAKLGESKSENLAAYWDSTTYNIILSCDPGEEDRGMLSMSYGPPQD